MATWKTIPGETLIDDAAGLEIGVRFFKNPSRAGDCRETSPGGPAGKNPTSLLPWLAPAYFWAETRRPVRTASVTQVRQPIYKRSVARWKHYENVLGGLFTQLAPAAI